MASRRTIVAVVDGFVSRKPQATLVQLMRERNMLVCADSFSAVVGEALKDRRVRARVPDMRRVVSEAMNNHHLLDGVLLAKLRGQRKWLTPQERVAAMWQTNKVVHAVERQAAHLNHINATTSTLSQPKLINSWEKTAKELMSHQPPTPAITRVSNRSLSPAHTLLASNLQHFGGVYLPELHERQPVPCPPKPSHDVAITTSTTEREPPINGLTQPPKPMSMHPLPERFHNRWTSAIAHTTSRCTGESYPVPTAIFPPGMAPIKTGGHFALADMLLWHDIPTLGVKSHPPAPALSSAQNLTPVPGLRKEGPVLGCATRALQRELDLLISPAVALQLLNYGAFVSFETSQRFEPHTLFQGWAAHRHNHRFITFANRRTRAPWRKRHEPTLRELSAQFANSIDIEDPLEFSKELAELLERSINGARMAVKHVHVDRTDRVCEALQQQKNRSHTKYAPDKTSGLHGFLPGSTKQQAQVSSVFGIRLSPDSRVVVSPEHLLSGLPVSECSHISSMVQVIFERMALAAAIAPSVSLLGWMSTIGTQQLGYPARYWHWRKSIRNRNRRRVVLPCDRPTTSPSKAAVEDDQAQPHACSHSRSSQAQKDSCKQFSQPRHQFRRLRRRSKTSTYLGDSFEEASGSQHAATAAPSGSFAEATSLEPRQMLPKTVQMEVSHMVVERHEDLTGSRVEEDVPGHDLNFSEAGTFLSLGAARPFSSAPITTNFFDKFVKPTDKFLVGSTFLGSYKKKMKPEDKIEDLRPYCLSLQDAILDFPLGQMPRYTTPMYQTSTNISNHVKEQLTTALNAFAINDMDATLTRLDALDSFILQGNNQPANLVQELAFASSHAKMARVLERYGKQAAHASYPHKMDRSLAMLFIAGETRGINDSLPMNEYLLSAWMNRYVTATDDCLKYLLSLVYQSTLRENTHLKHGVFNTEQLHDSMPIQFSDWHRSVGTGLDWESEQISSVIGVADVTQMGALSPHAIDSFKLPEQDAKDESGQLHKFPLMRGKQHSSHLPRSFSPVHASHLETIPPTSPLASITAQNESYLQLPAGAYRPNPEVVFENQDVQPRVYSDIVAATCLFGNSVPLTTLGRYPFNTGNTLDKVTFGVGTDEEIDGSSRIDFVSFFTQYPYAKLIEPQMGDTASEVTTWQIAYRLALRDLQYRTNTPSLPGLQEQLAYFRENPIAPHVQCAMRLFEWCCNAGMVAGAQVLHTALSDANVLASYPSSSQRALRQKWKASFLATQPKEEQAKTHYDHLSPDPTVFSSLSSNVHLQRSKMIECLAYVYPDVV
eukprot:m.259559 g.259559  ORF g.259559 m.259559 type:complete len:1286 (+) comp15555_c0_seq2:181-4038(+)